MGDIWLYVAALALVIAAGLIAAGFIWRRWRAARRAADPQRAMREFEGRRAELAAQFLPAAAATGKPRGLRWTACDLTGSPVFALEEAHNTLYALVGVTVSFEAIEGGGMEDVEAVSNLRSATAVFVHRGGQWATDGRVIFNLEPDEALRHFQSTLRPIDAR